MTPDQKRLRNNVLGIYLTDTSSSSTTLIGTVKDSVGELLAPNQVIYRDAFDGLKADMRYTYGKGFFEAEAILRESPVLPDGFKPESTVLQVVTEFIDPPTLDQSKTGILDFGAMQMIQGKAFSLSEPSTGPFVQSVNGKAASVSKQWTEVGLRHVLVESANYQDIQPQLAALPQSKTKPTQRVALLQALPPRPETKPRSKEEIRVASATSTHKGFSIDYVIVSGSGSYTFASDTTYYIPTSASFGGTVTFQPNCCIKFNTNAYLLMYGPILCNGTSSSPSILTSMDDDLYGEQIELSSGHPTYMAAQAMWVYYVTDNTTIKGMKIRWAKKAVRYDANSFLSHTFRDSRLEQCDTRLRRVFILTSPALPPIAKDSGRRRPVIPLSPSVVIR